jgi:hypothetical protein
VTSARAGRSLGIVIAVLAGAIFVSTASAASTHAEYIAQVDPICAASIQAQGVAQRGIGHLIHKERFRAAARKFRHTNRAFATGVEQVAALPPPSEDAQLIATWVQLLRAQLPLADRAAKALAHGHVGKAMARLFRVSDAAKHYVVNFGFSSCQDF